MLHTPDITKVGKIVFNGWIESESSRSRFQHKLALTTLCVSVKRIKKLLTPEELILIEIVSSVDLENLTPEILHKFEVLYRFVTTL